MRPLALYIHAWIIYVFFLLAYFVTRIRFTIDCWVIYTKIFIILAENKIYTLYQSTDFVSVLKKIFFCYRAIALTTHNGHDMLTVVNFLILCLTDVLDHFSLLRRYSNSKILNELLRESNALLKIKNIQERELILKTSEKQLLFLNSERDRLIELVIDLQMELDHRDQEEYS